MFLLTLFSLDSHFTLWSTVEHFSYSIIHAFFSFLLWCLRLGKRIKTESFESPWEQQQQRTLIAMRGQCCFIWNCGCGTAQPLHFHAPTPEARFVKEDYLRSMSHPHPPGITNLAWWKTPMLCLCWNNAKPALWRWWLNLPKLSLLSV